MPHLRDSLACDEVAAWQQRAGRVQAAGQLDCMLVVRQDVVIAVDERDRELACSSKWASREVGRVKQAQLFAYDGAACWQTRCTCMYKCMPCQLPLSGPKCMPRL